MLILFRRAPRPAGVVAILLAAGLILATAGHALAAGLGQEAPAFALPVWFLGLAPTIAWFINAVIFKAIESGGKELDSTAKRIIVVAVSLVIAAALVLTGTVALPAPMPTGADPFEWGGWVVLMTAYVWAGATAIYAVIEAAKTAAGSSKPA